jgi:hypothetical protein
MLGSALLLQLPLALAGGITAELDGGELLETHDPEVKVSGNVIVGVMVSGTRQGLLKGQLGIQSPNAGDMAVCLKVTSRDGAYMSENTYRAKVPESNPDPVYLPYQSNLSAIVERYAREQGDLAMTATDGNCEQTTTAKYFLPAPLDSKGESMESGDLLIFINGFDATDVYYRIIGSDTEAPTDCDYIEEGKHTAYNFSCTIELDGSQSSGPMKVEISREVYGRELDPVTINLLAVH